MKTEVYINPAYSSFNAFIHQIPKLFSLTGTPLHMGRNEVCLVDVRGNPFVVKYFKRITFANRFIYAHIRKSKARRSYEHSMLLLSKGITTPEPIAYIDCYKHGLLSLSFYVCRHTNYRPFEELLTLPITESEEALKAFARFSFKLHKNGIFHKDYSSGNVLYLPTDNGFDFSLIDNNRMRIRNYKYFRAIRSMDHLNMSVACLGIIAAEYAKMAQISDIKLINSITMSKLLYQDKISIKHGIKSLKKLILGQ